MPSNRRLRFLFALVVAVVIVTLYYSSEARETRNANFYRKTTAALEKSARDKRLQAEADAELQSILKHASELAGGDTVAEVAKVQEPNPISAAATQDAKIPPPPPGMEGEIEEQSIAGRKMMPKQKPKWDIGKDEEVAHNGGRLGQVLDPALAEAKDELNMILKKSPSTYTLYRSLELTCRKLTRIFPQSSYFPRATVHTRRKPKHSFSTPMRSYQHPTSSSLISSRA